jgi:hypothetical protein
MNSNAPDKYSKTFYADQESIPTILQFNANKQLGHASTLQELLHFMTTKNAHFALIQEPGHSIAKLPSHLKIVTSGRTTIIYQGSYFVKIIPEGTISSPPLDSTEIEVTLPSKLTFRLCSFYRPPTVNSTTTPISPLLQYLRNHLNTPSNIILGGDCNVRMIIVGSTTNSPPRASRHLSNFIEAMDTGGCLNDGRPTRIGFPSALQHPTPSAIDITLWNSDDLSNFQPGTWTPGTQLKSDHRTILIESPFLDLRKSRIPPHPNHRSYVTNRALSDISAALQGLPTSFLHHHTNSKLDQHPFLTDVSTSTASPSDIDHFTSLLTSVIQLAASDVKLIKHAPKKHQTPRLRHYNWTAECSLAKKTRDKALRLLRRAKRSTQDPCIILPLIKDYRSKCQSLNTTIQTRRLARNLQQSQQLDPRRTSMETVQEVVENISHHIKRTTNYPTQQQLCLTPQRPSYTSG